MSLQDSNNFVFSLKYYSSNVYRTRNPRGIKQFALFYLFFYDFFFFFNLFITECTSGAQPVKRNHEIRRMSQFSHFSQRKSLCSIKLDYGVDDLVSKAEFQNFSLGQFPIFTEPELIVARQSLSPTKFRGFLQCATNGLFKIPSLVTR